MEGEKGMYIRKKELQIAINNRMIIYYKIQDN